MSVSRIIHRHQVALSRRVASRKPVDLDAALEVVAPRIRFAAEEMSKELARLGIRHRLCGGLAVGAHGHPRATRDVDFLVGDEAFEHHGPLVTLRAPFQVGGVAVDAVPIPDDAPFLGAEIEGTAADTGLSVISLPALIYMKLVAHRMQDRADVVKLVQAGADVAAIEAYLTEHASDLLEPFHQLVRQAEAEEA